MTGQRVGMCVSAQWKKIQTSLVLKPKSQNLVENLSVEQ